VASEEDLVASAEQERGQAQNAAQEVARALGQATDDAARRELEDRARAIRAQLVALEATVNRAETRLTEAKQALDAESGRYDEIEALVDQLDRQLQGRGF
jgi:chromosome segregation ATPase